MPLRGRPNNGLPKDVHVLISQICELGYMVKGN